MTETSEEIFQALRQLVHGDPALQARLFALEDYAVFVATVQGLAQPLGHRLGDEEVRQAMDASGRAWFERRLP